MTKLQTPSHLPSVYIMTNSHSKWNLLSAYIIVPDTTNIRSQQHLNEYLILIRRTINNTLTSHVSHKIITHRHFVSKSYNTYCTYIIKMSYIWVYNIICILNINIGTMGGTSAWTFMAWFFLPGTGNKILKWSGESVPYCTQCYWIRE